MQLTAKRATRRYGRLVIDEQGITQKPLLFFFGRAFALTWSSMTAWALTETVILNTRTGAEQIDRKMIELRSEGRVEFVIRKPKDQDFERIVNELRDYVPQLETQSLVETLRQPPM